MPEGRNNPALAYVYLLRHIRGETVTKIAKDVNRSRNTVSKLINQAATETLETAKAKVMDELFPAVVEVYKAKLEDMKKRIEAGEKVSLKDAERIMKGMFVFDTPEDLRTGRRETVDNLLGPGPDDVPSLAAVIAVKQLPSPTRVIDVGKVDDED